MRGALQSLFDPASVAVVGASSDVTRIGGRVLDYLIRGGFKGPVIPVNPNHGTVQGLAAVPSIEALPQAVDVAVIALPVAATVKAVGAAAAKGVKGAIVFSSGFAETGEEGRAAEAELARIAREGGLRILGPNCLGAFNSFSGFYGTFTNILDRLFPLEGGLSVVSQSGAFGTHLFYLARERGIGLRYWISTGNECDVDVAQSLAFVADDPGTRVVLLYIEGARHGAALVAALEKAQELAKLVIAIKVGRSPIGVEAARSHTAALAGGDAVYDAVFRRSGVVRVASAEAMLDAALLADQGRLPAGRRLGIVSISGGAGILMADVATDCGLELPAMPVHAQEALKLNLPFASPRNPVDITAQAFNDLDLFGRNLDMIVGEGGYDAVIAFFTTVAGSPAMAPQLIEALRKVRRNHPERLIVLSLLAAPELVEAYEAEGYPVFEDPSRAVAAVAALARAAGRRRPAPHPEVAPVDLPAGPLSEAASKAILTRAGVPVVEDVLAATAEAAVAAFRRFARPVAMKIVSPAIAHKTEIGGVLLGIGGEEAVRDGFATLVERARRHAPDAPLEGVLVAPMVDGHVETVIGVERDPVFGPVVMFGLGGIHVEVLKDVTFRLAPFGEEEAMEMIGEIRGRALLEGVRGRRPADVAALARALAAVSRFAAGAGEALLSLDINPFAVMPEGEGAFALDALIVTRAAAPGR
jgi:acyl-CoA synthetase (NDP forming)